MMTPPKLSRQAPYLRIALGILLVFGILYVAKVVIVPIVVAVLLTFMLTPVVNVLHRFGLKRAYGVLITVVLASQVGSRLWAG